MDNRQDKFNIDNKLEIQIIDMSKRMNIVQVALMLALGAITSGSCSTRQTGGQKVMYVKSDTVRASAVATSYEYPGKVKASEEVNLSFQVAGKLKRLYVGDGGVVSKGQLVAELDDRDYRIQLEAVEAEYNNVKADAERVTRLYNERATTAANYDKARYGLQQITAKYENCKNQLADTKIFSPFSGRVQKHYYDAPAVIGAGMPVLCLVSDESLEIEINVPAKEYSAVGRNCRFEASFGFLQDKAVGLHYLSTSPKANANQLYSIRLAITGKDAGLAPGMSTIVKVYPKNEQNRGLAVPASAIFSDGGKSCVWLLSGGAVSKRTIEVDDIRSDGTMTILSGISAGDVIVTAGVHKLVDGQTVKALPKTASSNVGGLL